MVKKPIRNSNKKSGEGTIVNYGAIMLRLQKDILWFIAIEGSYVDLPCKISAIHKNYGDRVPIYMIDKTIKDLIKWKFLIPCNKGTTVIINPNKLQSISTLFSLGLKPQRNIVKLI